MATSGKQLSSLPSASSIAGNNEFLTWVGNNTAQKVSRDDFIKSLPTYRQPSTAYTVGNIAYHSALPTGWYLECTTAGTSGSGDITPTSTIGGTVTDGTVVWTINSVKPQKAFITDCNDATMTGVYSTEPGALNKPDDAGSYNLLAVSDIAGLLLQTLSPETGNITKIYTRFSNGWSWRPWQQQEAIVAKSLGKNGYIKYASGLIVQWGGKDNVNGNSDISFNVNFTTARRITVSPNVNYANATIVSVANDKFTVNTSGSTRITWIAIGY